ncbi:MAG: CRISPR-associated endonuclease Cas6 [bacterium]
MIKIAKLILELDKKSKYQDAQKLRGFFANTFSNIDLFHNHTEKGDFIYRYPRIQYRFFNNRPMVIGFNEGVEIIKRHYDKFETIKIGSYEYPIMEKQLILEERELKTIDDYMQYKFITPWYALNQENYREYQILKTLKERDKLLEKILITNILRMCKELDYHVDKNIELQTFLNPVSFETVIKDVKIIAFTGFFKVNMQIPDCIGLGKSISKGFGTIIKN